MLVLGIETSCDETACALLEGEDGGRFRILSEVLSSQGSLHEKYGGVVPELASREHLKNLPLLLNEALKRASVKKEGISLIAVTRGPGLKGCLLVGLNFASGLALGLEVPIIGVNHIEGHLLAPFLDNQEISFPYLALVVSGGHTEIVRVDGVGRYEVIARTIDDAAGEAFDKSASLLGFPYPGGPLLAKCADENRTTPLRLPRVMREAEGFSFSGLKTAVSRLVFEHRSKSADQVKARQELSAAVQEGIVDALVWKLKGAISATGLGTIVVTGGVSANSYLREEVEKLSKGRVFFPNPVHCTDNAAMIAFTGWQRFRHGSRGAMGESPHARWPVELMSMG